MNLTEPSTSTVGELLQAEMAALAADGGTAFAYLVVYTSFGVVRGRARLPLDSSDQVPDTAVLSARSEVLELTEVSVEHYSNHLATASFDRLFIRFSEVRGFSIRASAGER